MTALTPKQVVAELDKYIVGQAAAKRAVAVALRNRHRRSLLPPELQAEVVPKNILMIGPTGVGKTEIARRLAKLVGAPFVKVEATKYTEVGYVGRDVESMIRDLVEVAVRMVRDEQAEQVRPQAERAVVEQLLDVLAPLPQGGRGIRHSLEALFRGGNPEGEAGESAEATADDLSARRAELRRRLAAGELEQYVIEIELEANAGLPLPEIFLGPGMEEMGQNFQEFLGGLLPKRKRRRKMTIAEARPLLLQQEAHKLVDQEQATAEAITRAESHGIIFIDEIDKIAARGQVAGPDVSREGVQRDILPIVEGCTANTKYGPVHTDHILFIAAGAFHVVKPADMIPELQGRFPIRVELEPLAEADFVRILTEPENALTRQYHALLATENVELVFAADGVREVAAAAARVNEETEDIGARRLHTVLEKLLEDISFLGPDIAPAKVVINAAYVREKLDGILAHRDVSRFIL